MRGEGRQLEEGRMRVEQPLDAIARQHLALRDVPIPRLGRAAHPYRLRQHVKLAHEPVHALDVRLKLRRRRVHIVRDNPGERLVRQRVAPSRLAPARRPGVNESRAAARWTASSRRARRESPGSGER